MVGTPEARTYFRDGDRGKNETNNIKITSHERDKVKPMESRHELQPYYRTFITACHILHYHEVVDAYGHLSFRHPNNPSIFIMASDMSPATISSPKDLVEYNVSDATPAKPDAPKGYLERCIHSEIYKLFPEVKSVIHSHSLAVVPYTVSKVPLRATYHNGAFLGHDTPNYDIGEFYQEGDRHDMLVCNTRLGGALASKFSDSGRSLDHAVVLMRGHGMTVAAKSMEVCLMRAVYTQQNAKVQTTALLLNAAYFGTDQKDVGPDSIQFLKNSELKGHTDMMKDSGPGRAWGLWLREVETTGLYVNLA